MPGEALHVSIVAPTLVFPTCAGLPHYFQCMAVSVLLLLCPGMERSARDTAGAKCLCGIQHVCREMHTYVYVLCLPMLGLLVGGRWEISGDWTS